MGRRRKASGWWFGPGDAWSTAALVCLFGGAVLLVVAWYDISGTANVYEQLPYLVSAGFPGLALIIVGSALLVAGRGDRLERRLSQLVDALTEARATSSAAGPDASSDPPADTGAGPAPEPLEAAAGSFLVVPDGRTYHRPGCLLLRDKPAAPITPADIEAGDFAPCPVCGPKPPIGQP